MSSRAWFGVDFKQQLLEKKFTLPVAPSGIDSPSKPFSRTNRHQTGKILITANGICLHEAVGSYPKLTIDGIFSHPKLAQ
jgi:hypothetical protein